MLFEKNTHMIQPQLTRVLFLLFTILSGLNTFAQINLKENYELGKGYLYFYNRSHDFGEIKEEDGLQFTQFVGYNIAKDPLVITDVSFSCNCTGVTYKKDTLYAGDSVVFYVNFSPANQNGQFEKAVIVTNNGIPFQVFLTLTGTVRPRTKSHLDKYTINLGNLRVTSAYHDFGFLYEDEVDTFRIEMYNSGTKPITIKGIKGRPSHIDFIAKNLILAPGQESSIDIIFDARQLDQLGDMMYYLNLLTDDVYIPDLPLNINAHILERFPKQTKRRIRNNPVVDFDTKEIDFGKVLKGDTVKVVFTMYNRGKGTLSLRRIQSSCGCTAHSIEKMDLKKGESTRIEMHFYTRGREGNETKFISVITNDPAKPISKLYLKGVIVENPNAL